MKGLNGVHEFPLPEDEKPVPPVRAFLPEEGTNSKGSRSSVPDGATWDEIRRGHPARSEWRGVLKLSNDIYLRRAMVQILRGCKARLQSMG